jgi:hypothetical protein
LILKLFVPLIMVASALLAGSARAQEDQRVTDAKVAAASWLVLLDAGQYQQSWQQAASPFRAAVTQENWLQAGNQVRKPLGPVTTRTLKSAQYTRTLPGAAAGEYVVIQYDTVFANKADATETITPMRDTDGKWKVSGWFVR